MRRSPDPIKDRDHPSSCCSSSELLHPFNSPLAFRRRLHLPLGFVPSSRHHSRAATFLREHPTLTSSRAQAFTASPRFLPRSSLQAYFIPQPRLGSFAVQGLLSRRSHPSSSEGAFLLAVDASPLIRASRRLTPARAHDRLRCLSASRLLSTPDSVLRVWLFTAPEVAPLFGFLLLQVFARSTWRGLSPPPSALVVAGSVFEGFGLPYGRPGAR